MTLALPRGRGVAGASSRRERSGGPSTLLGRACLVTLALLPLVAPPALAQTRNPPSGVTVERDPAARQVIVRWEHAAGVPVTHFHVWRGTPGTPPASEGIVGSAEFTPGASGQSLPVLVPGGVPGVHAYRVRSLDELDSGNNSRWSDEVEFRVAETVPVAVENVRVANASATDLTVVWENAAQPSGGDAVVRRHVYVRHSSQEGVPQDPGPPCATVGPTATSAVCAGPRGAGPASGAREVWVVTEDAWGDRTDGIR